MSKPVYPHTAVMVSLRTGSENVAVHGLCAAIWRYAVSPVTACPGAMVRPGAGSCVLSTHAWAIWLAVGPVGTTDPGQGTCVIVETGLYGGRTVPTGMMIVTMQY